METEQTKRSILKTITWRITASLDTFIIAWIITGDWKMGDQLQELKLLQKIFFLLTFMKEYGIRFKMGEKKKMVVVILIFQQFVCKISYYCTRSSPF